MLFVETPVFTKLVGDHLEDDEYRALQVALLLRPEQGTVIRGSGGLRKLRWRSKGRGKRGGLRVIYFWAVEEETCYMLFLYGKNEQGDLTPAQVRTLAKVVREEFG
jgi:mRNA-degrading endonuclease RelE of RelBE toxin-antitoxin system